MIITIQLSKKKKVKKESLSPRKKLFRKKQDRYRIHKAKKCRKGG